MVDLTTTYKSTLHILYIIMICNTNCVKLIAKLACPCCDSFLAKFWVYRFVESQCVTELHGGKFPTNRRIQDTTAFVEKQVMTHLQVTNNRKIIKIICFPTGLVCLGKRPTDNEPGILIILQIIPS